MDDVDRLIAEIDELVGEAPMPDSVGGMVKMIDQTLKGGPPVPTPWMCLQALLLAHGATLREVK